ncbi:reverse transcriptase domain-containing protein [Aeromonas caviae]|uniref:reverse transcriptase domain-containing protein n=1 Tax=Aeromonas caviae TaxID=648 RepID=UPI00191FD058|nr:reverse transcriptase domain-containing protein [Aeromonas caviae]MBL0664944.1 RNA-directed DNA polymerase [Aeromonas caviae]MDX7842721.1 reverse transcriptase domain-containing protein [Aeromonas caviae]
MIQRTFKQAFNAVFHDKENFEEFLTLDIENEVEKITVENKIKKQHRLFFRQSEKLKKYLRFVDRVILRNLAKDNDVVHSFTKDKSTLTAVSAHSNNDYFFQTDISSFYSSITKDDVLRILKRDINLIPIVDISDYIDFLVSIMTYDGVLPVGFSTSPQISNAFLFEFDGELNEICRRRNIIYTRYADDIILSGMDLDHLKDMSSIIDTLIFKLFSGQITLNKGKTKLTWKGNKVKILGLTILPNGVVTIDKKYKNTIETLLHLYTTDIDRFEKHLSMVDGFNKRSLFGLLHYANSIDPQYISKLQRKYGSLAVYKLMEASQNDD